MPFSIEMRMGFTHNDVSDSLGNDYSLVRRRVVLAEDDDLIRTALATLLEAEGYEVIAVENGISLLDLLAPAILKSEGGTPPDAIVTDVRMPGFDVLNMIDGLRQQGWDIPIFVISAYIDRDVRERLQNVGVTAYFEKPIDISQLFDKLRQSIR